jgi:GDP-L-fucose synthase
VDLRNQRQTEDFVNDAAPEVAFIAAAKVGGINANRTAQADFLYENLMIAANCLHACQMVGVEKVVVLGSSCIYPRDSAQPIREDSLLTGPLEETNEGYAIAKIAALELGKMLRRQYGMDVVSLMPTNLYGQGDNYDLKTSHVVPAMIRKTHDAKVNGASSIEIWGSGRPRREFLHVDDLADATVFVTRAYSGEGHLNVGTGEDISIIELAGLIAKVVGWEGDYVFDPAMPDGTPRKLLDVSRLRRLGWSSTTSLHEGLRQTYRSFLNEYAAASG